MPQTYPDAFDLDEFRMVYGDPRPTLHNFLLKKHSNTFVSVVPTQKQTTKFSIKHVMQYACDSEWSKVTKKDRPTRLPEQDEYMKQTLLNGAKPIVIIPVMAINKNRCAYSNNRDKHVTYYFYNRVTRELERIDLKKYSLQGFKMLILDRYAPNLLKSLQPKMRHLKELDLPTFLENVASRRARIYPVFALAYLCLRAKYPNERRNSIMKRMKTLSAVDYAEHWKLYVKYVKQVISKSAKACKSKKFIRNPANNKCIVKDNASLLVEAPMKTCMLNKVVNPISGRCVLPESAISINLLEKELRRIKVRPGEEYLHLDSQNVRLWSLLTVLKNYPYAWYTYPHSDKDISKIPKAKTNIKWTADDEKLHISKDIINEWKAGIRNTSVRFVISFVSMKSGGMHANSVIYDKKKNVLEIFDPMGNESSSSYKPDKFYDQVNRHFRGKLVPKDVNIITPRDYCPPSNIFQSKEVDEVTNVGIGGACAIWRLWWMHIRLANPDIDSKKLVKAAMRGLTRYESFTVYIRSYQKYILLKIHREHH